MVDSGGSQASILQQAFTLTKRSFINMSRDFGYYWLRLVIYIIVTICIGSIYLNIGTGYSAILVQSDFSLGSPRIQWFVRINHLLIDVYSVFSSFLEPP